jgi:TPR repeat protein
MGHGLNAPTQAWRVAALTMMGEAELKAAIGGEDAGAWVGAAAACGIAQAQLRLGRMLLEGRGVAQDRLAAFSCFRAALSSDSPEAHNMVGRCYENGWGTAIDRAKAAWHYRRAAEAGLDWAQYNLGHMLLSGDGVAQDRDAAFGFYSKAAAQGHARAMNLVARCLENGWGVARDDDAARDWYRRSALGGYFRGAYNYATLLAAEGCRIGARHWFAIALETAPEPTRSHMQAGMSHHLATGMRK